MSVPLLCTSACTHARTHTHTPTHLQKITTNVANMCLYAGPQQVLQMSAPLLRQKLYTPELPRTPCEVLANMYMAHSSELATWPNPCCQSKKNIRVSHEGTRRGEPAYHHTQKPPHNGAKQRWQRLTHGGCQYNSHRHAYLVLLMALVSQAHTRTPSLTSAHPHAFTHALRCGSSEALPCLRCGTNYCSTKKYSIWSMSCMRYWTSPPTTC